jgi:hypothetical protein
MASHLLSSLTAVEPDISVLRRRRPTGVDYSVCKDKMRRQISSVLGVVRLRDVLFEVILAPTKHMLTGHSGRGT